jgi:hypothetical protein
MTCCLPKVILGGKLSCSPPQTDATNEKRMKIYPQDIRIDHLYHGPGKDGRTVVTHLPTGLSVSEDIPMGKSALSIQHRLISALKMKIHEEGKS